MISSMCYMHLCAVSQPNHGSFPYSFRRPYMRQAKVYYTTGVNKANILEGKVGASYYVGFLSVFSN